MNLAEARKAMVDNQIRPADVTDYAILGAFLETKREHFVPDDKKFQAYGEYEIEFAEGRRMMSPRSFAKLVQLASPRPHEDVLLIGCGMGYEAAILSQLCSTVIALGATAALVKASEKTLAIEGYDNAVSIRGKLDKGAEKSGPYDLIFFNGSVEELPTSFIDQLKPEGRIAVYVQNEGVCTAKLVYVNDGRYVERDYYEAAAAPLPGFAKKHEFSF